jgi:MFS family permease
LESRNFRLLWSGFAVSSVGTWMQIVAQSLLVLDLTGGSAAALGTVSLVQAVSFLLFAPLGGSAADRYDKRRVLLVTQSVLMGFAMLLGVLAMTGAMRFWMIPAVVFLSGATLSFDQPARNALIASLVAKEDLMNAVSLQSAVFNTASLLGPALAGFALSKLGYAGNFFLNAGSYLAMLGALVALRVDYTAASRAAVPLPEAVREVLRYVRLDAVLPAALLLYGALLFFGPSSNLVLPVFATQVTGGGAAQVGWLFSAVGAGTILSAVTLASLGNFPHKSQLLAAAVVLWMGALVVFGLADGLGVALPALVVLGAAQNVVASMTITLLQTRVPPEMRGRAMSLNTLLIMCVRPMGDFPVGAAISSLGFRPAVLASAGVVGLTWAIVAGRWLGKASSAAHR